MAKLAALRRHALIPLLILVATLVIATALIKTKPNTPTLPDEEKVWLINSLSYTPSLEYAPQLTLYGEVETPASTQLSSSVNAFVDSILVREGTAVSQGQLLASLDPRDLKHRLTQQQARIDELRAQSAAEQQRHQRDQVALEHEQTLLKLAENEYNRRQSLGEQQLFSKSQVGQAAADVAQAKLAISERKYNLADHSNRLQQLQAALRQAQAQAKQTQLDLSRMQIRAPADGYILSVNTAQGAWLRSGEAVLSFYPSAGIELRAQVADKHLPALRRAMTQTHSLSAQHGDLTLTLSRLGQQVGNGGGGVDAFFQLPANADLALGQVLTLQLNLPSEQPLAAIPPSALYGQNRIYQIKDQRLVPIPVDWVGQHTTAEGQLLWLIDAPGLAAGSEIMATQLANAVAGLKVQVTQP